MTINEPLHDTTTSPATVTTTTLSANHPPPQRYQHIHTSSPILHHHASTGKRGHDATADDFAPFDKIEHKRRKLELTSTANANVTAEAHATTSPDVDVLTFSHRLQQSPPASTSPSVIPRSNPQPVIDGPVNSSLAPPLFFSHTNTTDRPRLPPRFSSGEAGERMLSQAQTDESNFKTVTLARGSFNEITPPGPGFLNFASRSASEKSSNLLNPESPDEVCEDVTLQPKNVSHPNFAAW